jgi:hypothetical protein
MRGGESGWLFPVVLPENGVAVAVDSPDGQASVARVVEMDRILEEIVRE